MIRETAETTKLGVVYDCSARGEKGAPSFNDCLETGPSLQNKIYDVLVRGRFHPVVFAADMRKAFLQVRVRGGERDALRFHWLRDLNSTDVIALRFTRAVFGLAPSPFLLGGIIDQSLKAWSHKLPQSVAEILRSLYVDDLISGNATITKAKELKSDAVQIFSDAGFHLHKWHSNAPELEESLLENVKETKDTYAKQNLNGEGSGGGTKLLGLEWDKSEDTLAITFPQEDTNPTKRAILGKLARIYDPLGLTSPTTLQEKLIYRDSCTLKLAWDAPYRTSLLRDGHDGRVLYL